MNLPRLVAMVSIVGVLGVGVWVLTHLEDESGFGPPRTKEAALPAYSAAIPRIGDFASEFNINEVNPFVPFAVSQKAEAELAERKRPKPPVKPPVIPPPPPAAAVVIIEPKKPQYPAFTSPTAGAPECLGVVRKDDAAVLVLRLPGQSEINLEVGGELNGWKLQAISDGRASFVDPSGALHELPIGSIATPHIIGREPAPTVVPPSGTPATPPKPKGVPPGPMVPTPPPRPK